MTLADIKARPFGALSDSQGRSHQQGEGIVRGSLPSLPERQSLANMPGGLGRAYGLDILWSTEAGRVRNRKTAFDIAGAIHGQTKFFQGTDYSNVLLVGPTTIRYSKEFYVDRFVLHGKGQLGTSKKLPTAATWKIELGPETLKLQEVLETRKTKTQFLGDSILHSFDILSAPPGVIRQKAADVFASGSEEVLEDGMESSFARNLAAFLKEQGHNALQAVEDLIRSPETNRGLAFEATRLLGAWGDSGSHIPRRKFLEELLDSTSVRLRHAAASGLAAMDDPAALSAVERATTNERNERLKKYLTLVLEQLQQQR